MKVGNELSKAFPVPSGVPQGGCASPMLYSIFVLEINKYLPESVKYLEYADDLKLYCDTDSADSRINLQLAVDGIARWCNENNMILSAQKCVVVTNGATPCDYSIDGILLPTENVVRDLGVFVSADLDFNYHIAQTVKSALLLVNTNFRCFVLKEPDVYIRLYKSLVISKLLYCSPVACP